MRYRIYSLLVLVLVLTPLPLLGHAAVSPVAGESCYVFERSLTLGSSGADVKALQKFLNAQGFTVSLSGIGSPGLESSYFGAKTRAALALFQASNSVSPSVGYFGPLTRKKIASVCASVGTSAPNATTTDTIAGTGGAFTPPIEVVSSTSTVNVPAPYLATSSTTAGKVEPRSIVGLLCTYRRPEGYRLVKGSGVIINPEGYVLTARHTVDPQWTMEAYGDTMTPAQADLFRNSVLDHCEIGLPDALALPSAADIKSFSPALNITNNFQYDAEVYFTPARYSLSAEEYNTADFAVLKISRAATNCAYFNSACNEFGKFPYTPVSVDALPQPGIDEVISYGYPADTSGASFSSFYLKGSVGTVGDYFRGDQMFSGEAMNFSFNGNDIQSGRSGSGLFYQGRVIGILYGSTSPTQSYNMTITAIRKILAERGIEWVLKGQ